LQFPNIDLPFPIPCHIECRQIKSPQELRTTLNIKRKQGNTNVSEFGKLCLQKSMDKNTKSNHKALITYGSCIVIEITGKFDEPDITFWNGVFLKDVSSTLNRR